MKFRPYLFEVLILANLGAITLVAPLQVGGSILDGVWAVLPLSIACAVAGVAVRLFLAWRHGRAKRLLTVFRSRRWLVDSLRLQIALGLLTHTYGWIKLLVPVIHPRLYDRQLFVLDRTIFGGIPPSVFLLNLFSNSWFLRFIDVAYANVFLVSLLFATAYFFSSPRSEVRIAYVTSNVLLWLVGAWLYVLVPSLGPAYRFPDVWLEYSSQLRTTQNIQAVLMQNYRNVLRLAAGQAAAVKVVYGIAAFPSLHVGYQTLVAFWMRREWVHGEIVFGICAFFILIGSMITGWHYFVDGIAGAALAAAAFAAGTRLTKLRRPRPTAG